jgi:hypothetical protein
MNGAGLIAIGGTVGLVASRTGRLALHAVR